MGTQLNASSLAYSNELPDEPGYYWLKRDGAEDEVVEIWIDPNDAAADRVYYVHHCGSGSAVDVSSIDGALWAGPIAKPQR